MKGKVRGEFIGSLFVLVITIIGALLFTSTRLMNERVDAYEIQSISEIHNTHGSSDSFETEIYHLVHTDKGVFKVEMSGLNAAPHCAGLIHKGDTLVLRTRGLEFPFFGLYPDVIEVIYE